MIRKTIKDHKRILFNGNGYDDAWIKEATEERGLLNLRTTPDAIPHLLDEKNVKMLISNKVFTEAELRSRHEITLDNYNKAVLIEANTMADMARKEILPAVSGYCTKLASAIAAKKAVLPSAACAYESDTLQTLCDLTDQIATRTATLETVTAACKAVGDAAQTGYAIRDKLLPAMDALRQNCDRAETLTPKTDWPFPTYSELLFW